MARNWKLKESDSECSMHDARSVPVVEQICPSYCDNRKCFWRMHPFPKHCTSPNPFLLCNVSAILPSSGTNETMIPCRPQQPLYSNNKNSRTQRHSSCVSNSNNGRNAQYCSSAVLFWFVCLGVTADSTTVLPLFVCLGATADSTTVLPLFVCLGVTADSITVLPLFVCLGVTADSTTVLPLFVCLGVTADSTTVLPLFVCLGVTADSTTVLPLFVCLGVTADSTTVLPLFVFLHHSPLWSVACERWIYPGCQLLKPGRWLMGSMPWVLRIRRYGSMSYAGTHTHTHTPQTCPSRKR